MERVARLQRRIEMSKATGKLSEAIARLRDISNGFAEDEEKTAFQEDATETLEQKMDRLELRFGELEESMNFALAEAYKKAELEMKRKDIVEFMLKKYTLIQSLMERNEKKLTESLCKKADEVDKEVDEKLLNVTEKIDQLKEESKEITENVEENGKSIEKVENETIQLIGMLNEQQSQVQNIEWMHDEITSIKQRELQIINLLKDEADVEEEFLSNITSDRLSPNN